MYSLNVIFDITLKSGTYPDKSKKAKVVLMDKPRIFL